MALNPSLFHSHDFAKLSVRDVYRILVAAIVPRPIAFVTTINDEGVSNLAPFSFFNGVCSNPPTLMISIARLPNVKKKDTLLNLERNGEFVVNSAEEGIAAEVNAASEAFPYGISEIDQVGLSTLSSTWIRPPRILESAIQMECRLEKLVEIGADVAGGATLAIGRILGVHLSTRIVDERGEIQYAKLKPVARLGRDEWLRGGEIFRMPRP